MAIRCRSADVFVANIKILSTPKCDERICFYILFEYCFLKFNLCHASEWRNMFEHSFHFKQTGINHGTENCAAVAEYCHILVRMKGNICFELLLVYVSLDWLLSADYSFLNVLATVFLLSLTCPPIQFLHNLFC